jgi:ABC-2 type transport system permease protein
VDELIGDSQTSRDLFLQGGGSIVDAFYATAILMLALVATGFTLSSVLRPRSEEDAGRVESLLGTALSRRDWLLGHVVVTVLGTAVVLLVSGFGMGVGYALVTGDTSTLFDYVVPTLGYAAPVLVLGGLARTVYGLAPRLVIAAWLALVYCWVVMMFGELFRLPQWSQDLSPFEHLALVPAEDFGWTPFLVLLAVAAALSVVGQAAFRRRDVH